MADITLRLAVVQIEAAPDLTLSGFVLVFADDNALQRFHHDIREYFISRKPTQSLQIGLTGISDSLSFFVDFGNSDYGTSLTVQEIDSSVLPLARRMLSEQRYYFVLSASGDDKGFETHFDKGSYFFKQDMQIDNVVIHCNKTGRWSQLADPFEVT
ncbi:hypothetical protein SK854_47780 [Lentzea sp. BCCO 10_0061]|uniref:Uncharacterized protein n=1 Tax=Lentzea sokolovensis TaxID=3095429 RepID=A0ABU4VDR3_9PSEU|nr:hypothetical protein [Lentzea sp. BCCO 10_0061]MDX8149890.1 hypothetical protein [Lentzea sp. BCCO 10_0061]